MPTESAAPSGSSELGYDPASMAKGLVAIDGATTEVSGKKLAAADVTYKRTEQAQVDQYSALANSI